MNVLNFFSENWGSLASVLGAVFTVGFSFAARKAAIDANESSKITRDRLQSIDLLTELNRLNSRVDDLMLRLESKYWPLVSERANDLRVSLAAISNKPTIPLSSETVDKLGLSVNQFKNIAAGADRAQLDENSKIDTNRYRRIVVDQKEAITLAIQEVKTSMGEEA